MKLRARLLASLTGLFFLALAAAAVQAQPREEKLGVFYRFDAGVALQHDVGMEDEASIAYLLQPLLGGLTTGSLLAVEVDAGDVEVEFDPGLRMDFAVGYSFTDHLSAELSAGLTYHSADTVSIDAQGTSVVQPNPMVATYVTNSFRIQDEIDGSELDLSLYQIPVMVNLTYHVPLQSRFKPFVGGGLGGIFSFVSLDKDSETSAEFAWQVFTGLNYRLTDSLNAGMVYKFLGTADLDFDNIRTDGTRTHMIGLSLSYGF